MSAPPSLHPSPHTAPISPPKALRPLTCVHLGSPSSPPGEEGRKRGPVSDSKARCVLVMLIGCMARGDLASFVSHAYSFTLPPCGGRELQGISCFQLQGFAIWYEVKGAGGGAQESCSFCFVLFF